MGTAHRLGSIPSLSEAPRQAPIPPGACRPAEPYDGGVGLVSWIVVGFVAGAVAGRVTHQRLGCLAKIAVGVIGALIGGALARAAGIGGLGHFGVRSLLLAAVGATTLELVLGAVERRGRWRR